MAKGPFLEVRMSWNLWLDVQQMMHYHFMRNAFLASALVALAAGVAGYFMVLRGQSFAGHMLAHVGFAGASGAAVLGISPLVGMATAEIAAAFGVAFLSERRILSKESSVAIATVQTLALGLGLAIIHSSGWTAQNVYALLYGSILGISDQDVYRTALLTLLIAVCMAVIGRPLLFATLDPDVAAARGVPVRLMTTLFLLILALATAQSAHIVGTLLVFSLLVTPGAIAERWSTRPGIAVCLAMLLGILFLWTGIAIAFYAPFPAGFFVTSIAFGTYLLASLLRFASARRKEISRT